MELDEAQICRLCGQCESIYIDVFGEEGTKRFLGLKIHTKINILIDERDPLPKAICVQCLGKLEFVCDFQEECLRTQQVLLDRYNLLPLTDVDEIKLEDATDPPINNNSTDKNRNPLDSDDLTEDAQPSLGNFRNPRGPDNLVNQKDDASPSATNGHNVESVIEISNSTFSAEPTDTPQAIPSSTETNTHWLRSRTSMEKGFIDTNPDNSVIAPIANRLRSQSDNSDSIIHIGANTYLNLDKPQHPKEPEMVQIPTSALNKVLRTVANSPNMEVSVKESMNRNGDNEDINFTVELRKKQNADCVTVLAKVFPDQGSCMVDSSIVKLLDNQNGLEIRSIVNRVFNRSSLNDGSLIGWTDFSEDPQGPGCSPEELFKMDGEEIRVDDNIEHVTVDNQSGYECRLCHKSYERKDKCTVHVKTHLGIKQFVCILCCAKFVCKSDVMKHIRCSHTNPRPIQCPKCPKRFRSKFDLSEHDNVHRGVKPYSCSHCGQDYHHKVSLQMHVKSHLPSQNLACEYCGKVFPFRTRLLSHVASVHMKERRNFRCHFCYNLYSSLSVLNEHIRTRHAATHTCGTCGKKFKVASKYKAHVLQHTNPKPYACHVCNNRYASKAFLHEHLLKHEGLRKHVCQKCGADFAQASHLAAHRHVHGEKKYACPECGRRFNRQDNMKVHRKRHFPDAEEAKAKRKALNLSESNRMSIVPLEK